MAKNIDDVIRYCKRDNLDKERLASFWPKHLEDIKDLPVYSLEEIDRLFSMIEGECAEDPLSQRWWRQLRGIKSCYSFFVALDSIYAGVGPDIVELLLAPFDEVPLHVNIIEPRLNLFIRWRLEIRK